MIFRPNALHIERLATLLLFGFIIWFAFNAGYWRHDDPAYTKDEWKEFEQAGRFLLAYLHPWARTLTGGIAFSLSCILVYALAVKQLSNDHARAGHYLIPLLLILNIPFFEITTWSGQSLMALSMLVLPELIFRNYRIKVFAACILVWNVHPSYVPLCLIYFVSHPHYSSVLRASVLDALCFMGGVITAFITVRLSHGLWFGFDASLSTRVALDFSNVFNTYKSALLERSPHLMGGRELYSLLFISLALALALSIYRKRKDALYFGLVAVSLILFWPLLFAISPWPHWSTSRHFVFLGVVFFFCALSIQRLFDKTWLYIFIIAGSLPAQMALTNFYAFSTQTNIIKGGFRELVGNYEGLIPIIIDARDGDVRRWVRLPYGRQERFSADHAQVPRFDKAMRMNWCVSERWQAFEQSKEHMAQNCHFFNGLSGSDIVQCSVKLPVVCSYGVVNNRLLLKVVF